MVKLDHPPLLGEGFRTIGVWQLDEYFLRPFQDTVVDPARRRYLINNFKLYLRELVKLQIQIEIWIDGSFTTKSPEPDDIDIVVWIDQPDLDTLSGPMLVLFDRMITERELVKVRYNIDVYLGERGNENDEAKFLKLFTGGHLAHYTKGFFKLILTDV
ncbi:DUF6932 family protein [Larkinella rosea]|uniref:Uncharacterized protein n=1 Tax=Larkinella rosea TaxID=2025312 RepID=A0A3P1BM11_9BACT|nr:hypothetical protein [Larkinella rosea]RRB02052.1 hypothetical protein EHT25_16305 [Larkinella rosea]